MPTIRPRARSVRALGCMGTCPVENYYFSSFVGLRRAARLRLAGGRSNGIAGRSSRTVDSLTDQSDAGRPRRGRGADAAVIRFSNAPLS